MTRTPATKQTLASLVQTCIPDARAIYLFGSFETIHQRPDSDIDLGVLADNSPSSESVLRLKSLISAEFRRDVDFVDMLRADSVTIAQIISDGDLIYATSQIEIDQYEVAMLAKYLQLNEDRRDIVNDIIARGSVYGR